MVQIERRSQDMLRKRRRALGLACELRKSSLHTATPFRRERLSLHKASILANNMMLRNASVGIDIFLVLYVSCMRDVLQLRKHRTVGPSAAGMLQIRRRAQLLDTSYYLEQFI